MRRLLALLAIALAPGTDDQVVQRLHVRFAANDLVVRSCRSFTASFPEPGLAAIDFRFEVTDTHRLASGEYTGKTAFSITDVVIHLPRSIAWPNMTLDDHDRAERLRRAILHHEIGHVRVAEAVRDELNAQETIVEPDAFAFRAASDARGRDGFSRFKREERDYDALTDHGRVQDRAPEPLAGPDTVMVCRPA